MSKWCNFSTIVITFLGIWWSRSGGSFCGIPRIKSMAYLIWVFFPWLYYVWINQLLICDKGGLPWMLIICFISCFIWNLANRSTFSSSRQLQMLLFLCARKHLFMFVNWYCGWYKMAYKHDMLEFSFTCRANSASVIPASVAFVSRNCLIKWQSPPSCISIP